ncbi:hypothetical protein, partial [Escherichia coli]|uniref:hypothetical protein n=1 Tax=Escherichia coli TaxID=562 RepID=UPI001BE4D9B8
MASSNNSGLRGSLALEEDKPALKWKIFFSIYRGRKIAFQGLANDIGPFFINVRLYEVATNALRIEDVSSFPSLC